jgi:hypothetical protein
MKTQENQHCGVCEPKHHERNNYYYGKQFCVRDLQLEQRYFLDKMALTNRAILGWGVVCGFEVEVCGHSLVVHPGLALDCCGHQILVCEQVTLCLEELAKQCSGNTYALCLEYTECETEEIRMPPDDCERSDRHEHNRIRDHYRIRLVPWDDKCHARGEDPLPCPDHQKLPASQDPEPQCPPPTVHSHLCHHLQCRSCDCCACVVLGQVTLTDPPVVDVCTHRRIVYSNSMLYKLIECYHGDLAHIIDFNWRKETQGAKTRRVDWEWFFGLMRDGLKVYFDRRMDANSISHHTFIVTLNFGDPDSGRTRKDRVPPGKRPAVVYEGECSHAIFYASEDWLDDERKLSALRNGFGVEITLRGSNIYTDASGGRPRKALDGDFIGENLPTGNGTPGGDFFDWFQVKGRPQGPYQATQESDEFLD